MFIIQVLLIVINDNISYKLNKILIKLGIMFGYMGWLLSAQSLKCLYIKKINVNVFSDEEGILSGYIYEETLK